MADTPMTARALAEAVEDEYNRLVINDFNNLNPRTLTVLIERALLADRAAELARLAAPRDEEAMAQCLREFQFEYRSGYDQTDINVDIDWLKMARHVLAREGAAREQAVIEAREQCRELAELALHVSDDFLMASADPNCDTTEGANRMVAALVCGKSLKDAATTFLTRLPAQLSPKAGDAS